MCFFRSLFFFFFELCCPHRIRFFPSIYRRRCIWIVCVYINAHTTILSAYLRHNNVVCVLRPTSPFRPLSIRAARIKNSVIFWRRRRWHLPNGLQSRIACVHHAPPQLPLPPATCAGVNRWITDDGGSRVSPTTTRTLFETCCCSYNKSILFSF